jgi:hypothetical protein
LACDYVRHLKSGESRERTGVFAVGHLQRDEATPGRSIDPDRLDVKPRRRTTAQIRSKITSTVTVMLAKSSMQKSMLAWASK